MTWQQKAVMASLDRSRSVAERAWILIELVWEQLRSCEAESDEQRRRLNECMRHLDAAKVEADLFVQDRDRQTRMYPLALGGRPHDAGASGSPAAQSPPGGSGGPPMANNVQLPTPPATELPPLGSGPVAGGVGN